MGGPADGDVGLEESRVDTVIAGNWLREIGSQAEVSTLDGNGTGGILVLNSELSIDKSAALLNLVDSNGNALLSLTEHLDDHLVMGDPWGDTHSVSDQEGVLVPGADVFEGNGVWLLSSSAHAEDLVAVWVVEEVLVLPGVWHEEGVVGISIDEGIVAPLADAGVVVGFRVLEPAVALVVGVVSEPVLVLLLSEGFEGEILIWLLLSVEVVEGKDPEALVNGKLNIVVFLVSFTGGQTVILRLIVLTNLSESVFLGLKKAVKKEYLSQELAPNHLLSAGSPKR